MKIAELLIYPIKSLGGISLLETEITMRGLKFDRRWVLVDEKNKFLSQREQPLMATLSTEIIGKSLKISTLNSKEKLLMFGMMK
jgi:uncharacterized protein